MGGSESHASEERMRELERREKEMVRRKREAKRRAMELGRRQEEMGTLQVRYELPAAAGSSGAAVDRPDRSTDIFLPMLSILGEHLKAEYHPELEAREMSTEVPNPVRRDSKELQPHINMPESEAKPPATPERTTKQIEGLFRFPVKVGYK